MFDYDKEVKRAVEFLDEYDFSGLLQKCVDIKGTRIEIYEVIEFFAQTVPHLKEEIEALAPDEFMDYLRSRYNIRFEEVSRYYIWCPNKKVEKKRFENE